MIHLKTILLCISGAIVFGIVHDMITANICVEYFTIGHPKILESENPFVLALLWGVLATWWVGLMLGIFIIVHNIIGKFPPLPFETIKRWVLRLLLIMCITSPLAGLLGYILAKAEVINIIPELGQRFPSDKHVAFLGVGWAHLSSYLVGFIGGIAICVKVWNKRLKLGNQDKRFTS